MKYADRLYANADRRKAEQEWLNKFAEQQPSKSTVGDIKESDELYTPWVGGLINGVKGLERTAYDALGGLNAQLAGWGANQYTGAGDAQRYKEFVEDNPEFAAQNMATPEQYEKTRLENPTFWQQVMGGVDEKTNYTQDEAKKLEQSWMLDAEKPWIDRGNNVENVRYSRRPGGWGEQLATDVAANVPQLAEAALTGAASGAVGGAPGAAIGAALSMAKNIYGQSYGDLRRKGRSMDAAHGAAAIDTLYQMPFEYMSASRIFKTIPGLRRAVGKLSPEGKSKFAEWLKTVASEGSTEFVQTYGDSSADDIADAIERGDFQKDFEAGAKSAGNIIYKNTLGDKAEENFKESAYAGLLGGIIGGGTHGAGLVKDYVRSKLTTPNQKMIDEEVAKEEARVAAEREQEENGGSIDNTASGSALTNNINLPELTPRQREVIPVVFKVAKERGYDPMLLLSHMMIESGAGFDSELSVGYNNFGGISTDRDTGVPRPADEGGFYEDYRDVGIEGGINAVCDVLDRYQGLKDARTVKEWNDGLMNNPNAPGQYYAEVWNGERQQPGREQTQQQLIDEYGGLVQGGFAGANNYTDAKAYIEDYAQQMDLITKQDNELFATLNKLANEGTEEEVIKKAQELGYQPKVAEEETPTQEAPKEAPKPTERPQGTAQVAKIETARTPTQEAEAPKVEPIQGTPYHINNSTPTIKRSADKGNFNNRGSYNGRLAPQNVNNTVQAAGLPLSQPTQAIPQGENQNAENLQTQTAKRGENRENTNVNAEPKQTIQNKGNENVTHSQGNEVTPTLAPSNQGTAGIAQNTSKIASDDNVLTADKVDGKALEKATAANKDTVLAKSEVDEAKAKENAALDSDSTVTYFKKIVDEKTRNVKNGKMKSNDAIAVIQKAYDRAERLLKEKYARKQPELYEKLRARMVEHTVNSVTAINDFVKQTTETKQQKSETEKENGKGQTARKQSISATSNGHKVTIKDGMMIFKKIGMPKGQEFTFSISIEELEKGLKLRGNENVALDKLVRREYVKASASWWEKTYNLMTSPKSKETVKRNWDEAKSVHYLDNTDGFAIDDFERAAKEAYQKAMGHPMESGYTKFVREKKEEAAKEAATEAKLQEQKEETQNKDDDEVETITSEQMKSLSDDIFVYGWDSSEPAIATYKRAAEDVVRAARKREITLKEAIKSVKKAWEAAYKDLSDRYAWKEPRIDEETFKALNGVMFDIYETAEIMLKSENVAYYREKRSTAKENKAAKEPKTEVKPQEKKTGKTKETTLKLKTENQKTDKEETAATKGTPKREEKITNETTDKKNTGKGEKADGVEKVKLSDGYKTESGRTLAEAGTREFIIRPDGSMAFGHFNKDVEEETNGAVLAKEIRLQVGFSRMTAEGQETGFGIKHIKKREKDLIKLGYKNAEEYILDVIENFSVIYKMKDGRIKIASISGKFNIIPLDLELQGNEEGYYTIVSALPKSLSRIKKEAGEKIFDRSASLSPATGNRAAQNGDNSNNASAVSQSATEKSSPPTSKSSIREEEQKVKPKKEYPAGKKTTLITDKGDEFSVTYKLMPVEDVITSNDANFGENANFPAELQPRDRDREGLKAQVRGIAEKINPRELTETIFPNQGAPVINEDNVAESGNGRTIALTMAYTDGGELYKKNANKYKSYLAEHAEDFGFTKEQVEAIDHPILVRQRTHESDHLQMDIVTSTRGGARLSAGQQARIDAKKISEDTLSLYRYDGSGDLTLAANRDFVAAFIDEVVAPNDRDVMQNKHGELSGDGLRRIKLALCAKAYENSDMIDNFSESTDPEAKNFVEAYKIVAPRIAAVKNIIESGGVSESFDLPKLLDESLKFYLDSKKAGIAINDALNTGAGLFKGGESQFKVPGSREFVEFLAKNARKKKAVVDAMTEMAKGVTDIANNNKHDSLIEDTSETTLYDIVKTAIGQNESNFIFSDDGKTLTAKPDKWKNATAFMKDNVAAIAGGKNATKINKETGTFTFPDEITREEAINFMDAELDTKFSTQGNIADKLRSEAKAIPENELTEREKGIAAFARRMGVRVQFFNGNENLHGWQQGNVVFLNRNSAKDLNKVFWHEVFHWLAGNNPALYEKLKKAVLQNDDIAAQIEAYKEETGRTDLTTEEAIEEMLADAMMDASTRGKFFETLGVTHPTLVQKIIKWLKNTYNDLVAQFRRAKGFRPEAGLTNTQIKRMSVSLDGMALKLKDGQGNRLFRADSKGNLVSVGVKDVAYVDGVKYLVTNKNLHDDDMVKVVHLIDGGIGRENVTQRAKRLTGQLMGKQFKLLNDDITAKADDKDNIQHFLVGRRKTWYQKGKKRVLSKNKNIKRLVENSVYVESRQSYHEDKKDLDFVKFYAVGETDGRYIRFEIGAYKDHDGTYTVSSVSLSNLQTKGDINPNAIKKGSWNTHHQNGGDITGSSSSSFVRIADLLENVKDDDQNFYVKNGELQYENSVLLEKYKPAKLSINFKDLSDGNVFSDEKRNKANNTILQKLEIGNDADVKAYLGRFIGQKPMPPKHPKVDYDEKAVNGKKELAEGHFKYTLLGSILSPSRSKNVIVKTVFNWADNAKRQQAKLYAKWTVAHKEILDLIQDPKDLETYTAILLDEDSEKEVLTDKELRKRGASDNVIKAHAKIRKLLKEIRSEVAKVYTAERAETKNFSSQAEAEAWAKTPFFRNVDIKRIRKTNGVVWQVKYLTPQYETNQARMTVEELEGLKGNDEIKIISESLVDPNNPNYYDVEYMRPVRSLADIDFYIPHFFHDFLIVKKTMKNGEEIQSVVGSGTSIEEAVERANALAERAEENDKFEIVPKALACEDETSPAVVVGDKEYGMLTNSIKEGLSVTLEEARDALAARTTNRHVFLSALQHRKGASGWETNMRWVIQHHIAASSRYCGLEPFKTKAINLFERRYGAFDGGYFAKNPEAALVQDIVNAVLGKPGKLENFTNSMLRFIPWFKDTPRPSRVVTSTILGAMSVFKLGVSPAAAVVNMTQLINIQAYLGAKWTKEGMNRAWKLSEADLKLLEELGTREETGLETVDVDEDTALVAPSYAKQLKAIRNAADKAMWAFTKAESFLRKTAVLGAYHKALAEGKTEGAARAYALEVNRNANFDYSVVDEPGIFRNLKGTIIGDLFLQFKKYGIKELEVIVDMATNKNIPKSQRLAFFGEFFLLGGLFNSVPFQEVIVALIGMALDTDDPEAELKKWLMQKAGESEAAKEAVLVGMYGAGALIGMDISQRVGFRNLVPEFDEPLGVTGSTVKQIITALDNGDPIGLAKAVSPAVGNIASAIAGHNTDSKGRISYVYESPWERVLRLCGFRTIGEALSVDTSRILTEGRSKRTKERDKAKEEYFKNPSRENKQKLKELGYTDGQIKNLKPEDKSLDRKARLKKNMTKQELKDYKDILEW